MASIVYPTTPILNHSSRRLVVNQKPTTLRQKDATVKARSLRYFEFILILERSDYTTRDLQGERSIKLSIKSFRTNCFNIPSLSSPNILLFVYNRHIYILDFNDIPELLRRKCIIMYPFANAIDISYSILPVMYMIGYELCMIQDALQNSPLWNCVWWEAIESNSVTESSGQIVQFWIELC